MRIIGISPFHDASVAVINNGQIEYFAKEERFTRKKRDSMPYIAIEKAFENAKGPVDLCVMASPTNGDGAQRDLADMIVKRWKVNVKHVCSEHHNQHANLAFFNSGFDEALCFVIDRNGSVQFNLNTPFARESESVYKCSYPANFTPIMKTFWLLNGSFQDMYEGLVNEIKSRYPDADTYLQSAYGIVKVYEAATSLIGQHPLDNGKTMGLSAYGEDIEEDYFIKSTHIPIDSWFHHSPLYGPADPRGADVIFSNSAWSRQPHLDLENYKPYANKAFQVQKETQNAVLRLVKKYVEKTGIKKVCITGGYGLNVVCNQYLIKNLPDVDFYFEPMADDTGNSIGGAMMIYREETRDTAIYKNNTNFFHNVAHDLSSIEGNDCTAKEIAQLLANGKSIAVFNGQAEAGPRALGNRSILFDATNPQGKDIVNKIKNREWYRPFAGVVLKEDADKYFDMMGLEESRFMTINFDLITDIFPAITHVDNTSRIQTVDKDNPLYPILVEFKRITGHGVLLNTSFNLAGDPLVETPQEAIDVLNRSLLDHVYFPEIGKLV